MTGEVHGQPGVDGVITPYNSAKSRNRGSPKATYAVEHPQAGAGICRTPTRRAAQIFLIATAAPYPRRSCCSSENVCGSPIRCEI